VNTYKETDMSEENAIPESPEALPGSTPEAAPTKPETLQFQSEATPGTWVSGQPETFVPNVEPVAPASVAESAPVPLTEAEKVAALSVEIATTLHDVFQYIHQGFDQHSLMIGMSRFYEIARAVKARAEA
jgi:hypothetical protein